MSKRETEFSIFANILSTYFQEERNNEIYTKWLFENIYSNEDDVLEQMELRTYRAYFYGANDIGNISKKIAGKLDLGKFAEALCLDSEDAITSLCESFREWCPDISADTYGMDIAERFQKIIIDSTIKKRMSPKKKEMLTDMGEEENIRLVLATEVKGRCPCDNCVNSLFLKTRDKRVPNYEIVIIDLSDSHVSENNMIAMCRSCATKYNMNRNISDMNRLKIIKKKYSDISIMQDLLADQKIDDSITNVLKKVACISGKMDVDLNYEPVPVMKKIKPDNKILLARIKLWVNMYYYEVDDLLQSLSIGENFMYEPFCLKVRMNYYQLKNKHYTQDQIYDAMINWLHEATNEDRNACEIVIAYFVQKCEVFDALS